MARSAVSLLSFVTLAFVGAISTSCGSSSYGGGGNSGPFNVAGDRQATFSASIGASTSGVGAVDSSGLAAFFDSSGNIVKMPTITGASTFSGNLTAYAVNPTFFPNGTPVVTDTAQGNVTSATAIAGTFTGSGTASGSFTLTPNSPLTGSIALPAATLNGKTIGFIDTLLLTFSPDGSFTGGDFAAPGSTCNVSGKLTQAGTSNVFNVVYNTVSGSCTATIQTGLAFESSADYFNVNGGADTSYLYVMMLTSTLSSVRPTVYVIYQ